MLREHVLCQNLIQSHESNLLPKIQNEMIDIMGQRVRKQIIGDIETAKHLSFISDSTSDISHQVEPDY